MPKIPGLSLLVFLFMISSCTYLQKRELRKIRTLPIPESVQAYQHIQFTVLSSMEEQECFLQSLSPRLEREWQPPVWRAFRSAIIDARIDYSTHALVLIPLHLGAIANNLHIGPAEIRGKRLIFLAGDGPSRDSYLPSESHYCRAYVVSKKRFKEVEWRYFWRYRKKIVKSLVLPTEPVITHPPCVGEE